MSVGCGGHRRTSGRAEVLVRCLWSGCCTQTENSMHFYNFINDNI